MRQHKPNFSQILATVEKSNSEKLMIRARTANNIAKRSRGHQKQLAYSVKHNALSSLIEHLPTHIEIRKDIVLTDFVVVELKNSQSGLHHPIANI